MTQADYPFPDGFLWGTATSAYQVEGGGDTNDWYDVNQQGCTWNEAIAGRADEWWAGRAEEDIQRMAELGTTTHRLSIAWDRIEPRPDQWDETAIARYRAILIAMRAAGIRPMITLHHFTNPLWLNQFGCWQTPATVERFDRYVTKAVESFGDLCDLWCTINEPSVYALYNLIRGKNMMTGGDPRVYFRVIYHMLKGHARAYATIHQLQPEAQVGLAQNMVAWYPANPRNWLDVQATRVMARIFSDATLEALQTGHWRPLIGPRKMIPELVGTLDWIGMNYYQRFDVRFAPFRSPRTFGLTWGPRADHPHGPPNWGEFYPQGMIDNLRRLRHRIDVPIYITENGIPSGDDARRERFLVDHLHAVWQAIQEGMPIQGYYFWSLIDNFEWHEGYDPEYRFGLYAVDFDSQERTLRDSGRLYREIIRAGGLTEKMVYEA